MMIALKANAKDFQRGTAKAQRNLKGFVQQSAPAFGPLNTTAGRFLGTFGMGVNTVKSMIPAIKGVKAALAASGIGAVLIAISGALAGVSAYLTKTVEGADKLNVAWTRTKAVGSVFFDRMIDGGKGLLKIISGNREGLDDLKNSFKGVFKEAKQDQAEAAKIAEEENKLKKDKIDFITREAQLQMEIADLIRKSKLLEYDRATRTAYLNTAIEKQNQLSDTKVKITQKELSLQQRRMDLGHLSYEDLQKEAELKRDMLLVEKDRDDKARELENRVREVNGALNEQEKLQRKILQDQEKMNKNMNKALQVQKDDVVDLTDDLADLRREAERVTSTGMDVEMFDTRYLKDEFKDLNNLSMIATSGIYGMSAAFNDLAATGSASMKGMVTAILSSLEALVQGYLATMIASALASEAKKGLIGLITGSLAVAGFMALWRSKVPDFAAGGLVYGDTLARVGEYRGAATNPEVIAPLNKLQGMMGAGKLSGRLETEGTKLVALIEKVKRRDYNMR